MALTHMDVKAIASFFHRPAAHLRTAFVSHETQQVVISSNSPVEADTRCAVDGITWGVEVASKRALPGPLVNGHDS